VEHWRKGTPFLITLPEDVESRSQKTSVCPKIFVLVSFNGFVLLFNFSSTLPNPEITVCLQVSVPDAVGIFRISVELLTNTVPMFAVFSY
jgi:hypothetical protein